MGTCGPRFHRDGRRNYQITRLLAVSVMKTVITTAYGPPEVLEVREVERPTPKRDEVLIRIHKTTVAAGDCEIRRFDFPLSLRLPLRLMFGIFKPRIKTFGQEFAGEIIATGNSVTNFDVGDQVFGPSEKLHTHAEYICLKSDQAIAKIPKELTFDEAASIPVGGANALHFLHKTNLTEGQSLLVIGAGGSIGTYTVQLAKNLGAEVTAVDRAEKLDMLRSIGADDVVDYMTEDFSQRGRTYDAVIDIIAKDSFERGLKVTKKGGTYLITNIHLSHILRGWWITRFRNKKVIPALADYHVKDLEYLAQLIGKKKLKPVFDEHRFNLDQIMEAHTYVETGLKQGCLVVDVE